MKIFKWVPVIGFFTTKEYDFDNNSYDKTWLIYQLLIISCLVISLLLI